MAQDLGPEVCTVPCRWDVNPAAAERADVVIAHATYSAAESHRQRRRPGQSLAVFSLEPVLGWGPHHNHT